MQVEELITSLGQVIARYGTELITAFIGLIALWFRDRIFGFLRLFWDSIVRIQKAREAIASDTPWLVKTPRNRMDLAESEIPILTFANLKGGVGKTTLAANVAAYFATSVQSVRHPDRLCRVLVIDLDFQGSLSSMILDVDQRLPPSGGLSKASKLISGALDADDVCDAPYSKDSDRIHGIAAYYDLARIETRTFMQWLIQEFRKDLRYVLRDLLHEGAIQQKYDIIIIDAPPRLSTAAIQALCASTHVIIPTKLDRLSADAVGTFIDQLEELRALWPKLKVVGAVGMMIGQNSELPLGTTEVAGEQVVNVAVRTVCEARNLQPPARIMSPQNTYIADSEYIRKHAGDGIAYLRLAGNERERRVREMIDRLGAWIKESVQ